MIFEWSVMLWLLAAIPVIAGGHAVIVTRRQTRAAATGLSPPRAARGRRLLPPLLFLGAIALLITALARPTAVLPVPTLHGTVILAMDISNSMLAEDLEPTRLAAAQKAARDFIAAQPATTQIGLVAFAETALSVQRPTQNREDLLRVVERLKPQEGTALGSAILVSLQTLFPKEQFETAPGQSGGPEADTPAVESTAGERSPGEETSAAIILLTDGQATGGPNPIDMARRAAERGVRIYAIGIGTPGGAVVKHSGMSMRVQLDDKTLKEIADLTLGRYFAADNADALGDIYRDLSVRLRTETRETELTSYFVAAAALLCLAGAGLSLTWFNRIL